MEGIIHKHLAWEINQFHLNKEFEIFCDEFWYYYCLLIIFPKTCLRSGGKFLWVKAKNVFSWAIFHFLKYTHFLVKLFFGCEGLFCYYLAAKLHIKLISVNTSFSPYLTLLFVSRFLDWKNRWMAWKRQMRIFKSM